MCCYPTAFLRVQANRWFTFFERIGLAMVPHAFQFTVALHLLKHVRYVHGGIPGGKYDGVLVIHGGKHAMLPIDPIGFHAPLNTGTNRKVFNDVCAIIGMPCTMLKGASANNAMRKAVNTVLGQFTPSQLLTQRDASQHIDLLVPPVTGMTAEMECRSAYCWAEFGVRVSPVVRVDVKTGKVDKNAVIDNEDVIALRFADTPFDQGAFDAWVLELPDQVQALLPSEILLPMIKNLEDLGQRPGLAAALNVALLLASSAHELRGSTVGSMLKKERPLIVALPTGTTEKQTTMQGKTNVVSALAHTLVPDLPVTIVSKRNSAPADRSMTSSLKTFKSAILDEFILGPPDGIFSQTHLQGLCTGATIHPGEALANSDGLKLDFPLFLTMKFSNFPPDLRNRQIPIFLHALTSETRATDTEARELLTGRLAKRMRLSLAVWKHQHGFIARARTIPWTTSPSWRYQGHFLIAEHILHAGADVVAYLKAAEAFCDAQYEQAHAQGLVMATGGAPRFDPVWYFNECSDAALNEIWKSQLDRRYTAAELFQRIVEDQGKREFIKEVSRFKYSEQGANSSFIQKVEKMTVGDWRIQLTDGFDHAGRPRKFARLIKLNRNGSEMQPPSGTEEERVVQQITTVASLAQHGQQQSGDAPA